ncbi:MAG: hypothetical protein U9P90_01465 [Patescibacteria group bacterium]|nr:hypothetical protein [Patescibacteria group bacterium]
MPINNPQKPEGGHKVEVPKVQVPEKIFEKESSVSEALEDKKEIVKKKVEIPTPSSLKQPPKVLTAPEERDEFTIQIEKVLEEDLEEVYFNMSPDEQKKFKEKGEETANGIRKLLESVKTRTKEIIELITNWLKVIPGVNKFFIEQEAKIKANKILNIKNPK